MVNLNEGRERVPNAERPTPPSDESTLEHPLKIKFREDVPYIPWTMEPLRDWFCKGADMTSAAEYEAALVQLEEDPPDIQTV